MTGAPEGSPKVVLCGFYGFMEKPGIEPATPGLQGIALIHYTTGASLEFPTLGIRASPFCIKLCGIFHFYLNFNRILFMQTVHTLIKCNFIE